METIQNAGANDMTRQVQALRLLKAFDDICMKSKGRFRIVPLKGIDLIRNLYSDTLDRELSDIDIMVIPSDGVRDFVNMLMEEGYRPEFAFALDKGAMASKKKISMLPPSRQMPNIDVHWALVTKKFFSITIGNFNDDAIGRLRAKDDVVFLLDDVDRWLFLAAHLTFHFLDGEKWCRDLALLYGRLDESQRIMLSDRASEYNFERVVAAVCLRMQRMYGVKDYERYVTPLFYSAEGKRFVRYIAYMAAHPQRLGGGLRIGRYYWEFIFISKRNHLRRAFLGLMFPTLGNMQNIYRCNATLATLMYIPHVLINAFGLLLFSVHYNIVSRI